MPNSHVTIDPAILYFGTPVALLSTVDGDGGANLAPMSSIFWLGHTAVLGMGSRSQTASNLRANGEVVINLPSAHQVGVVNALALTTGRNPVPTGKDSVGYQHVGDKFTHADLTAVPSDTVRPARVAQCPVALEGRVIETHPLQKDDPVEAGNAFVFEVKISRVHIHPELRMHGRANRIDPDRWRPLIMSFQRFYGLGPETQASRLATTDEEWYR